MFSCLLLFLPVGCSFFRCQFENTYVFRKQKNFLKPCQTLKELNLHLAFNNYILQLCPTYKQIKLHLAFNTYVIKQERML